MNDIEIAWLAGILEGEGSFMRGPPSNPTIPTISLQMTDLDVVKRVADIFRVSVWSSRDRRSDKWKPIFAARVRGSNAVALMRQLRPMMGTRRQGQIDTAVDSYVSTRPGDNARKLDVENVRVIRKALDEGVPVLRIANWFGVSRDVIRKIRERRMWKDA